MPTITESIDVDNLYCGNSIYLQMLIIVHYLRFMASVTNARFEKPNAPVHRAWITNTT